MSTFITFSRISSLSRLNVCPSAEVESLDKPSISGPPSVLGDAYHEYMEQVGGSLWSWERNDIPDHARRLSREHACDEADLAELIEKNAFDPMGGQREVPVVLVVPADHECPEIHVPGTLDHVDADDLVTDYKSSKHPEFSISIERDCQLHGYGIAWADKRGLEEITIQKYYPVLGEEGYETHTFNVAEARSWINGVVRNAWKMTQRPLDKRQYHPNEIDWNVGCKGCSGVVSCEASRFEHRRALALAGEPDAFDVTRKNAVEIYEATKMIATAAKFKADLSKQIKALIEDGGPIHVNDNQEIRLVNGPRGSTYPQMCKKETA